MILVYAFVTTSTLIARNSCILYRWPSSLRSPSSSSAAAALLFFFLCDGEGLLSFYFGLYGFAKHNPHFFFQKIPNTNINIGFTLACKHRDNTVVEQPVRLQNLTRKFTNEATEFIKGRAEAKEKKPFFLYMSYVKVHTALFSTKEFEV